MRYNRFIKNTPKISEIGLGAWQLGVHSGWKGLTEEEAIRMVKTAFDLGINFIDTAPNYGHGTGESRLGKALEGVDRDQYVINTKFGHTDTGTQNYEASYIRTSLEGSLRRLKLDYVDSLIIHNPPITHLDGNKNDHYEILERLKEEGKIKAYGASIDTFEEAHLLMSTTESKVIEAFFNILHQDIERSFDMAIEQSVGIIVKIPLDSGWLTGKYDENSQFDGVRGRWSSEDITTRARLVKRIREIVPDNISLPNAAMAFCLAHKAVSTVIPGNVSIEQLRMNVESAATVLSPEVIQELKSFYRNEVKALQLPW